jgi:RNA polymerase sigma-70 factor, ECF subfamily
VNSLIQPNSIQPAAKQPSIESLVAGARNGDKANFGEIVRRYQGPLFGFLGRMGLTQAQAEDIAQEAFLRAWRNINAFDAGRAQFSTWLFAIARNLALNEVLSAKHKVETHHDENSDEPESNERSQTDLLIAQQDRDALQKALRRLPHDDRSVIALAYVNELDLAAIARIEHCSLAAVKTRLHRAKLKLRELLKDIYD